MHSIANFSLSLIPIWPPLCQGLSLLSFYVQQAISLLIYRYSLLNNCCVVALPSRPTVISSSVSWEMCLRFCGFKSLVRFHARLAVRLGICIVSRQRKTQPSFVPEKKNRSSLNLASCPKVASRRAASCSIKFNKTHICCRLFRVLGAKVPQNSLESLVEASKMALKLLRKRRAREKEKKEE